MPDQKDELTPKPEGGGFSPLDSPDEVSEWPMIRTASFESFQEDRKTFYLCPFTGQKREVNPALWFDRRRSGRNPSLPPPEAS